MSSPEGMPLPPAESASQGDDGQLHLQEVAPGLGVYTDPKKPGRLFLRGPAVAGAAIAEEPLQVPDGEKLIEFDPGRLNAARITLRNTVEEK